MAVAFDAVGPSSAGAGNTSTTTLSWTHTTVGASTTIVAGCSVDITSDVGVTATCTCDGVAMTSLGKVESDSATSGFLQVWSITGISAGAHTILVTPSTTPADLEGGSLSFTGAVGLGSPVTAHGTSVSASESVNAASTSIIAAFTAVGDTIASSGNTSQFIKNQRGGAGHSTGNAAGSTAAGTGSPVTISWALTSSADPWAILAVEVQGVVPPAPPAPTNAIQARLPGGGPNPLGPKRLYSDTYPYAIQPVSANVNGVAAQITVSGGVGSFPPPFVAGLAGGGNGYFIDQYGNPIPFWDDIAFGLPANAGAWNGLTAPANWQSDFDTYFSTRAAQGFTVAHVSPWGHTHTGCNNTLGNTFDGVSPWTTIPTLNSTFWTRIDYMVASAAANGITVLMNLTMSCDMGKDSFAGTGVFNGTSASTIQTAAQNIAARYASSPNVLFHFGDDYNGNDDTRMSACLTGLQAGGYAGPVGVENFSSGTTSRRDLSGSPTATPFTFGGSAATFNYVYHYNVTYFGVEFGYEETSPIPVVWGDGFFWGDQVNASDNNTMMRKMTWWALSSGARGCTQGSENVFPWSSTSVTELTSEGWFANSTGPVKAAFTSLPGWHKLVPDTSSVLVTAGRGTHAAYSSTHYLVGIDTDAYVTASRVPDGSLAVIYCGKAFSITIDQTQLGTGYTATWIDPASGATTPTTTGSTYSSSGLGNNSAGGPDWVLALQGPPTIPANVTGVAASVTVAGGIGTPSAGAGVTGVGASVTVAGGVGTPSGGAGTTGVGAAVTVAGGIGTPSGGAGVTGVGAQITVAGGAGTPVGTTNVVGVGAQVTVAGGVGTPSSGVNVTGVGAQITVAGGVGTTGTGIYRLMDGVAGRPGTGPSVSAHTGNFQAGIIWEVTSDNLWFQGFWHWVPTGGDTGARKFCLWQLSDTTQSVHQTLVPNSTITSGTLTANSWNFIALSTPIALSKSVPYVACYGYTAVNGFPDTQAQFGSGDPYAAGITNGPLFAYSSQSGSAKEPFTTNYHQGVFGTSASDVTVVMPTTNDVDSNFWIDVQVSSTPPTSTSYRIWPSEPYAINWVLDTAFNFTLGCEFTLSETCTLNNIWFYSPAGVTQLPTECGIWNVSTQTLVSGTDNASPSWSGAAGSGWISCSYTGVRLPAGDYKVAVFNGVGSPAIWNSTTNAYWSSGAGGSGVASGPITVPNTSTATSPGQDTYNQGTPFTYPLTYSSPAAGANYWVDVEVAPGITGVGAAVTVAGGTGTPSGGAGVSGVGAQVTVQGGLGTPAGGGSGNTNGTAAQVTVAAGTGTLSAGVNVTGIAAQITVQGGVGTPTGGGSGSIVGVGAQVTITAGLGSVKTGANVAGVSAHITVAGGIGSVRVGGIVDLDSDALSATIKSDSYSATIKIDFYDGVIESDSYGGLVE